MVGGRWKPGDALPTVRGLAAELGIHFNTVAQAYRVLAGEGWLELRRGRGARVLRREAPGALSPVERERLLRGLRDWVSQMRAAGLGAAEIEEELRGALVNAGSV